MATTHTLARPHPQAVIRTPRQLFEEGLGVYPQPDTTVMSPQVEGWQWDEREGCFLCTDSSLVVMAPQDVSSAQSC